MLDGVFIVNLALETEVELRELDINPKQVSHVVFYNPESHELQQCSYANYIEIAKEVWYKRCPDGENCRVIHPDLRIYFADGYLERATEEDGTDGWTSCGSSYSLVNSIPPNGTLLKEYIKQGEQS